MKRVEIDAELAQAYNDMVKALFKDMGTEANDIMHAAIGLAGEGGEFLDCAKKHWAYNKPLDKENAVEELGDAMFYIVAACQKLDIKLSDLLLANMKKLNTRYSSGKYSDEQAQARKDKVA